MRASRSSPSTLRTCRPCWSERRSHIEFDGTLIPAKQVAERGNEAWYSGKRKRRGGNLQVLYDPHGFPVWAAPVGPGSTYDIVAARRHVFPTAATWLPVRVDDGYVGADSGYHFPINCPYLDHEARRRNRFPTVLRAICERCNAPVTGDWRSLRLVTCCPKRLTQITRAALVLTHLVPRW